MSKSKHTAIVVAALVCSMSLLSGCGGSNTPKLANELTFELSGVEDITLSYDAENMSFYASDSDKLVVREYMTKDKNSYHAKVMEKNDAIHISEGGRPLNRSGFERYVEVYIPASYAAALTITSTSGVVELSSVDLRVQNLKVDNTSGSVLYEKITARDVILSTTSGRIEGGSIRADSITIKTTSGDVTCGRLDGQVTYTSTNGNIKIASAVGAGVYEASNSGMLDVDYVQVNGDLTFSNKNDDINLTLPPELEFDFAAESKNGTIDTNFTNDLTLNDRGMSGTIGRSPKASIRMTTHDGDIHVKR